MQENDPFLSCKGVAIAVSSNECVKTVVAIRYLGLEHIEGNYRGRIACLSSLFVSSREWHLHLPCEMRSTPSTPRHRVRRNEACVSINSAPSQIGNASPYFPRGSMQVKDIKYGSCLPAPLSYLHQNVNTYQLSPFKSLRTHTHHDQFSGSETVDAVSNVFRLPPID